MSFPLFRCACQSFGHVMRDNVPCEHIPRRSTSIPVFYRGQILDLVLCHSKHVFSTGPQSSITKFPSL